MKHTISVFLSFFVTLTLSFQSYSQEVIYTKPSTFYDNLPSLPKKGTLYFNVSSDPKVINPILSSDSASGSLEGYLWLSLMTLDPNTLNSLPSLASSYTISNDKKDVTFKLNPKAQWQDGTQVTSEDFKFTLDAILNPKVYAAALRSYYENISIKIIDKTTFVFHVPNPAFDTIYTLCSFVPIQKKQFAQSKNFNKDPGIMQPVGNGPYVLSKYERGSQIVFSRKKDWWGYELSHFKNLYNIDNIILKIIPDSTLAFEKLLKGDLDVLGLSAEDWHKKVQGIDKAKFGENSNSSKKVWALKIENKAPKPYYYVGWNEKNPIFQSQKTRMGLSYLVNYPKIIHNIFYGLSIQSTSPFGSLSLNSAQDLRTPEKLITFDKKKAFALFASDGWKKGSSGLWEKSFSGKILPFEFTLSIPSQSEQSKKIAQILKEDFKTSGIKVEIKSLEWNSFLDKVTEKKEFDATILGWSNSVFPNPKQVWHSNSQEEGGSNFIGYSNPNVDNLIAKANSEMDSKKRSALLQEINRILYHDQPYTFLTEPKYVLQGLNTKIKSPHWLSDYDSMAASELFYIK
jgi:peptide/nickel transport system substrate-binding protein